MMMKKLSACAIISALTLTVGAASVFADSYGSTTQPNDLSINKMVKNPSTGILVENLGSTDPNYSPSSTVTFRLTVKNTSGQTFDPVTVTDRLPQYLTYVGSSITNTAYDAGARVVTITLNNLIAGESRDIDITAKVSDASAFSTSQSQYCLTNKGEASTPARSNGVSDTADFCITTSVGGAEKLPVAGFEDFATAVPFAALGGVGLILTTAGTALTKKRK